MMKCWLVSIGLMRLYYSHVSFIGRIIIMFDKYLISAFSRQKRNEIERKKEQILPKYILKRRVIIRNNGKVVFDSFTMDNHEIPIDIQYEIKHFGVPDGITRNNNSPIVFNITSKLHSI